MSEPLNTPAPLKEPETEAKALAAGTGEDDFCGLGCFLSSQFFCGLLPITSWGLFALWSGS